MSAILDPAINVGPVIPGDDGLGVAGGVGGDVADGFLQAVHHLDGQDVVQKLGVEVLRPGGGAVDNFSGFRVQPPDVLQLVEDTSRASANELMSARGLVDLLIPRGGAGLIRACVDRRCG